MAGNSFGQIFRITTFGESHGPAVGVVIDGCPAGLKITREEIQTELDRRRPGKTHLTTTRQEKDQVEILSGIFEGQTLGTPIALLVRNIDQISKVYEAIKDLYRPGHADFSYDAKYGFRDWRGGGRASARETVGRVAAAAIAKKILALQRIKIVGYVTQIGKVKITKVDEKVIQQNPLYCPDPSVLPKMIKEIENSRKALNSIGGVVEVVAHGVPAGLGDPVFHKLSADLAQGLVSIPAVKGFEIGNGFDAADRSGKANNDLWVTKSLSRSSQSILKNKPKGRLGKDFRIGTLTNRTGGIIGGISTGEDIIVRLAFKPASSIAQKQQTVNSKGEAAEIQVLGRHDPCVCTRAVPVAEAMVALTLVDHYLLQKISRL